MLEITSAPLLNLDLGELTDEPEALYVAAELANVACGGHAGDARSMARAIDRCVRHGVRVGAHPSYPDRAGFGRRAIAIAPHALADAVAEQCAALSALARDRGVAVAYLKPHGALYHAAAADPSIARALLDGAMRALGPPLTTLTIIGPPTGALAEAARARGLGYWREGFADRGVDESGRLLPRDRPGALVTDPAAAAARAVELASSGGCDTLCVHGDSPGAVAIARAVRAALDGLRA